MDLKEKLVSSFMAFEEQIDVHSELHDVRTSAIKNFENKGFPTKKEEAWKYTSLNAILKNDFTVFPKHENAMNLLRLKSIFCTKLTRTKSFLLTENTVRFYRLPRTMV